MAGYLRNNLNTIKEKISKGAYRTEKIIFANGGNKKKMCV